MRSVTSGHVLALAKGMETQRAQIAILDSLKDDKKFDKL